MEQARGKEQDGGELKALSQGGRDLLNTVAKLLQGRQLEVGVLRDRPQISVAAQEILEICRTLKSHPKTSFKTLLCVAAVDYKEYIQMVYMLHSIQGEQTLAIKTDLPYDSPSIPSVSPVWKAADWYEREAHDLFGVNFEGHPDLSPFLLYEGFEGHPGLKEFPFHEYDEY